MCFYVGSLFEKIYFVDKHMTVEEHMLLVSALCTVAC